MLTRRYSSEFIDLEAAFAAFMLGGMTFSAKVFEVCRVERYARIVDILRRKVDFVMNYLAGIIKPFR